MTEIYDKYYFETTLVDGFWFIRATEFISKNISSVIPFSFTPFGITINVITSQDKKKNVDGHIITGYLTYNKINIPEYRLYQENGDSASICSDKEVVLPFTVDGSVISEAFAKSNLKVSDEINLFSKSSLSNLYYKKNKGKSEFTLKTVLGFTQESLSIPKIYLGDASYEFNKELSIIPNIVITVEEFNDFCGSIKKNESGSLKIIVYTTGAKFTASEYGNSGKDVNCCFGILSKSVDKFTMDVKFFSKLYGQLTNFCHLKSILYLFFGRHNGNPIVTISIPVGNSLRLLYQKEILQ